MIAARKKEGDELFERVKEATEAAPHFQGSTDAAGLTGGLNGGSDEATWKGLPEDDDALAEDLSSFAAMVVTVDESCTSKFHELA